MQYPRAKATDETSPDFASLDTCMASSHVLVVGVLAGSAFASLDLASVCIGSMRYRLGRVSVLCTSWVALRGLGLQLGAGKASGRIQAGPCSSPTPRVDFLAGCAVMVDSPTRAHVGGDASGRGTEWGVSRRGSVRHRRGVVTRRLRRVPLGPLFWDCGCGRRARLAARAHDRVQCGG